MVEAQQPAGASDESTVVEGVLDHVVFSNEENGWSVVKLDVRGSRQPVTAVGSLFGVQPGENLRLRGRWVNDKRYGEQFRVDTYLTLKPATLDGLERYLGSGLIPGLGQAIAARIVERFELETLDVIESHPHRLTEVDGIGPVRSRRIQQAWKEQRQIKEVMIFLQTHGVSTAFAVRIFRQYKERAISVVRENPYRLALEVFGIGFKSADRIANSLGIERDSPRRAEAGTLHALTELAGDGHLFYPRLRLIELASSTLEIDQQLVEDAVSSLADTGHVCIERTDDDDIVYLKALHLAEWGAADSLTRLLRTAAEPIEVDPEQAVAQFEQTHTIELAAQQREALKRALRSKVLVVTGGPGTGKTTIVKGLIALLSAGERRVSLCAPTGRAAKRLEEATGQPAQTIHRMLGYSPRTQEFSIGSEAPLEIDTLIVDEVSMIDIVLLHHLLRAIPPHSQLIMVGDADQLPSVGPGAVLQDLIDCGVVDVVRLTEIFRQARESQIVLNAHRVNSGEMPQLADETAGSSLRDFYFIERDDPDGVLNTIKELVTVRIPQRFQVDPLREIQVLAPMRRGVLGTNNLNTELQNWLNPSDHALKRGDRVLRRGDKVMQIRNNYDLDVFNGDIGQIESIDEEERRVRIRFDERLIEYDYGMLDEIVLAYACSIHKAQGSEYPVVVLTLHTQHYAMLQRNLLYTALTRGKRLVVLVGNRKAIRIALGNDRVLRRNCRLAERLQQELA